MTSDRDLGILNALAQALSHSLDPEESLGAALDKVADLLRLDTGWVWLLDETSGITGHGGGHTGRFALRYGVCLADFLGAPNPPGTRFTCPPVADESLIARELLLPPPSERPTFVREGAGFPEPVGALIGLRWALLGDSLVLVAPVDGGAGRLRLMYRSTGFKGGVYDATVKDGAIRATLSNNATVTLKPIDGGGTLLTYTVEAQIGGKLAQLGQRLINDAPLTRDKDSD